MTTVEHIRTTVLEQCEQVTPLSGIKPVDRTFDPNETCARCGPSTRAQFRWVFRTVSKFTHEHSDLYLCAHCSSLGEPRLLFTSILHVTRTHDQL